MKKTSVIGIAIVLAGCGDAGVNGVDGTSCSVEDNGDGSLTVSCDDGTTATVSNGTPGSQGSAGPEGPAGTDGEDGAPGTDGADGATGPQGPPGQDGQNGADGADGQDGADGSSCSVEQISPSEALITCTDGTSALIAAPSVSDSGGAGGGAGSGGEPFVVQVDCPLIPSPVTEFLPPDIVSGSGSFSSGGNALSGIWTAGIGGGNEAYAVTGIRGCGINVRTDSTGSDGQLGALFCIDGFDVILNQSNFNLQLCESLFPEVLEPRDPDECIDIPLDAIGVEIGDDGVIVPCAVGGAVQVQDSFSLSRRGFEFVEVIYEVE